MGGGGGAKKGEKDGKRMKEQGHGRTRRQGIKQQDREERGS